MELKDLPACWILLPFCWLSHGCWTSRVSFHLHNVIFLCHAPPMKSHMASWCSYDYHDYRPWWGHLYVVLFSHTVLIYYQWSCCNSFYQSHTVSGQDLNPRPLSLEVNAPLTDVWQPKNTVKIGCRPESLNFITCIGVVYSHIHHLKCKCSSKQKCFKLPCCTIICGRELLYPFSKCWH